MNNEFNAPTFPACYEKRRGAACYTSARELLCLGEADRCDVLIGSVRKHVDLGAYVTSAARQS
jgi:hypothetical protein